MLFTCKIHLVHLHGSRLWTSRVHNASYGTTWKHTKNSTHIKNVVKTPPILKREFSESSPKIPFTKQPHPEVFVCFGRKSSKNSTHIKKGILIVKPKEPFYQAATSKSLCLLWKKNVVKTPPILKREFSESSKKSPFTKQPHPEVFVFFWRKM